MLKRQGSGGSGSGSYFGKALVPVPFPHPEFLAVFKNQLISTKSCLFNARSSIVSEKVFCYILCWIRVQIWIRNRNAIRFRFRSGKKFCIQPVFCIFNIFAQIRTCGSHPLLDPDPTPFNTGFLYLKKN